jgi:hypothetical protein
LKILFPQSGGAAYTDIEHPSKGVPRMKIVVVKSPPLLKPLLRRIFGIGKKS